MKIRKYSASSEQEAIEKVKDELGASALILNIKKIQPRGFFAFFRKPLVEVTAAYEEHKSISPKLELTTIEKKPEDSNEKKNKEELSEKNDRIEKLQKDLFNREGLLEKLIYQLSVQAHHSSVSERKFENNMIQIFYNTLVEQGVTEEIANDILSEVSLVEDVDDVNLNLVVKIVYNKILNILGTPVPFEVKKRKEAKIIFFIGPTGVGKTTTIAKMSSNFILNDNLKVGLITADTYRIAAVEQLKTYAEILGIEVRVVYNPKDLSESVAKIKAKSELILIDTAGRSHKNKEMLDELIQMLEIVPNSDKYLVLSLTTKYEDLINIVNMYSQITDFKIIFTKLDETSCLGAILNICYVTGKKISYITNGQNVPDDIEIIKPENITKTLLGLGGMDL